MDNINTKMLVADPEAARQIKLMYEMYADPQTSLGDIVRYFTEQSIDYGNGRELARVVVSQILRNPAYAQADLDLYEFFKSQGAEIVNEAADFTGINGCYLYKGREATEYKGSIKDHILVLAPHEGIITYDLWLACRRKLLKNKKFGATHKAKNTWLAGKIKCGLCGSGLMSIGRSSVLYFRCRKRADRKTCEGGGTIRIHDVEKFVYEDMRRILSEFQTLSDNKSMKVNSKLTALDVELVQVETEIEKLIDTLTGANPVLLSYANSKIEALDAKRQSLIKVIADMSVKNLTPDQILDLSKHLNNWDDASFDNKRLVVDRLIVSIIATSNVIDIGWKF